MDTSTLGIIHMLVNFASGWPLGIVGAIIFFMLLGKFIAGLFKKFILSIIIFIIIAFAVGGTAFSQLPLGKNYQNAVKNINYSLIKPVINLLGN